MFDHDAPTVVSGSAGPVVGRAAPGRSAVEERLARLLDDARAMAELDLSGESSASVGRMLGVQKRLDAAITAFRASLVAACDDSVRERSGAVDNEGLLRARLGLTGREAKKEAALASGLEELPATREALREGRIGADHARRLASAASDGALGSAAQVESSLLDAAERLDADRFGRHVRRKVEQARSAAEQLSREREAQRRRSFSMRNRGDGTTELRGLLPTLAAASLETALGSFMTFDDDDTPHEARRTWAQRSADAFTDMVQASLSAPRDGSVGRARADVTVLIPWSVWTKGSGLADVGGRLAAGEVARQAACDAGISRLLAGPASQPLDLGRSSRDWSVAQRRAIVARDGHCRFVSCDRPAAWCHAHHVEWWGRDRGSTDVANGILLCQRHHTAVHVEGWAVSLEPDTGVATWTSPAGEVFETLPEGALHTLLGSEFGADPPPPRSPKPTRGSTSNTPAAEEEGMYGHSPGRGAVLAGEARARYATWPVTSARQPDGPATGDRPPPAAPGHVATASVRPAKAGNRVRSLHRHLEPRQPRTRSSALASHLSALPTEIQSQPSWHSCTWPAAALVRVHTPHLLFACPAQRRGRRLERAALADPPPRHDAPQWAYGAILELDLRRFRRSPGSR